MPLIKVYTYSLEVAVCIMDSTHTAFFSQLQQIFQQFYIQTKIFTAIFWEKLLQFQLWCVKAFSCS